MQQLCRYLYYLGRIRAIQLEYTEAKDCLQQALRKVCFSTDKHFCCAHKSSMHPGPWVISVPHSA
jgi:hypothetical protein